MLILFLYFWQLWLYISQLWHVFHKCDFCTCISRNFMCVCVSEATSCPCPLRLHISSCDSSTFPAWWCHWCAGLFGRSVLEGAMPWKSGHFPTRVCAANLPLNFSFTCHCPVQLNSPEWEPETYSSITHTLHKSEGELTLMYQCLVYQVIKVWIKPYVSWSALAHQSLCKSFLANQEAILTCQQTSFVTPLRIITVDYWVTFTRWSAIIWASCLFFFQILSSPFKWWEFCCT